MEPLFFLLGLFVLWAVFIHPIWTLVSVGSLKRSREEMKSELEQLRAEVRSLRAGRAEVGKATRPEAAGERPAGAEFTDPRESEPALSPEAIPLSPRGISRLQPPLAPEPTPVAASVAATEQLNHPTHPTHPAPPLPSDARPDLPSPSAALAHASTAPAPVEAALTPPPLPEASPEPPPLPEPPPAFRPVPQPSAPPIQWEQFMGAKLFAWIGGLALFLGVAFFIKYSFEHDLVPPEVRAALGFLLGAGLVVAGLKVPRPRYAVLAQTYCATGIVILYAVTFGCRALYKFPYFGAGPTMALMVLITAAAFFLAVRLDARVVGVLGILGGFLTPVLISTGSGDLLGLAGYLAVLTIGASAVALRQRWHFLVPLAAAGVIVLGIAWAERYFTTDKAALLAAVNVGFSALFLAVLAFAQRRAEGSPTLAGAAVALPISGFLLAFSQLSARSLSFEQPWILLALVFLSSAALLGLAWLYAPFEPVQWLGGALTYLWLSVWTVGPVDGSILRWALGGYLAFAVLHTAFPLLLQKRRPESTSGRLAGLGAPLALLLTLLPVLRLEELSLLVWPAVLLLDLLVIGLALWSGLLLPVLAAMLITLLAGLTWLLRLPGAVGIGAGPADGRLWFFLLVVGGFAFLFTTAATWLGRKLAGAAPGVPGQPPTLEEQARTMLPSLSALLPFALIALAVLRLAPSAPGSVFGLALLLSILVLGLAQLLRQAWLPLAALLGAAAVQYAWVERVGLRLAPDASMLGPTLWHVGFYALFTLFPFVFRRAWRDTTPVWAAAALSGIGHFWFLFRESPRWISPDYLGLLPLAFALPALAGTAQRARELALKNPARLAQLAWWGGVALSFITLIFPLQFSLQWLTLAWALEGVALLWYFHRVPHPGLRLAGVALLGIAFVRLALNPAVLSDYPRGASPILNWYLYTYGLVAACLFAASRLLAPPRHRLGEIQLPGLSAGLGVVLLFLLVNLEIADFFSSGDRTRMLEFSGNVARDLSYTIAWAVFALALLLAGIWRRLKAARYAALGLLSVTLLKLFLHDLASLNQLYRIGALVVVAVVAMASSFLYQRFVPTEPKEPQ